MSASEDTLEFVISEVAGPDVLPLVKYLENKKNVSEFKIAECIEKEINATRNMLYRLYNNNLASFIRKKDKEKGWYIYYWTFNSKNVKHLAEKILKTKIEKIHERLERENESMFYMCENGCMRLDFDRAVNFHFKCPECGELLEESDNSHIIKKLNAELKEKEQELKKLHSKRNSASKKNTVDVDFTARTKKTTKKSTPKSNKPTTKKATKKKAASTTKKTTKKATTKTTKKTTTKKATKKKTAKELSFANAKTTKAKDNKEKEETPKRGRKRKYNKKQDIYDRLNNFKIKK